MTLNTETNTRRMGERILRAGRTAFNTGLLAVHFEQGHWWLRDPETHAVWSVVDAEGKGSVDGFHFEEVVRGDAF